MYRKIKDNSSDANKVDSQVVSADKNWKYSFTNLPKYDSTGAEYEYTIEEEAVPGYETVISDDYQTISNYAFTEVNGEKIWNDKNDELHLRPNSITVELLQDGKSYQEKQITADKDGKWSYAFTDLPMYNKATNELYTYTVNEKRFQNIICYPFQKRLLKMGKPQLI
ncbi:Cna B-type domain-containing protein [Enterococcus bulliens]